MELRGLALHKLDRDLDALEAFDHALITDGGNYRIWNIRGLVQKKLHDLPGALAAFDRAVSVNPLFFVGWHNRGLVLLQMNRFTDAISSFDRALALNPGTKKHLMHGPMPEKRLLPVQHRQAGYNAAFFGEDTPVTGYRVV